MVERKKLDTPLPEDKQRLVTENLQLVHYIAHRYIKPQPCDYEDIYQEGCLGLVKAAIGFEEHRGNKFSTYAVPTIIGYMRRYIRDKKPLVKYSRSMMDLYNKIMELKWQGAQTDEEIIKRLNIGSSLYFDVLNIYSTASLDEPFENDEGDGLSLLDTLGYRDTTVTFDEQIVEKTFEDSLERVVCKLSDKYKAIYEEYIYCLFYGEKLPQEYFATKYDISQAQVSRILRKLNKVYHTVLKEEL